MKDKQLTLTVGGGGDWDTGQHLLKSKHPDQQTQSSWALLWFECVPKTHVLKTKIPLAPLLRDRPY